MIVYLGIWEFDSRIARIPVDSAGIVEKVLRGLTAAESGTAHAPAHAIMHDA
jgi:hypothetical protein